MAEHQLPKLIVRVRFPSPAPEDHPWSERSFRERPGSTLQDHPRLGVYLAKRSQLVADLAFQVQDQVCQGDVEPSLGTTGKPPEHRPHQRNRGVAGRQRHQFPRPPTNRRRRPPRNSPGPVETTPRPGYRARHLPASRCEGRRATGRTHRTQSRRLQANARTKDPNGVRAGRPRPADSTPQPSHRGAPNMSLHAARRWQDRQHTAESGSSFQIEGRAPPGRVGVSSLRCGPRLLAPSFHRLKP